MLLLVLLLLGDHDTDHNMDTTYISHHQSTAPPLAAQGLSSNSTTVPPAVAEACDCPTRDQADQRELVAWAGELNVRHTLPTLLLPLERYELGRIGFHFFCDAGDCARGHVEVCMSLGCTHM